MCEIRSQQGSRIESAGIYVHCTVYSSHLFPTKCHLLDISFHLFDLKFCAFDVEESFCNYYFGTDLIVGKASKNVMMTCNVILIHMTVPIFMLL